MPKKTITDEEIALIKAMLANNMKNKNIQFFFNRPNRPVNSGRISQIRKDNYANSKQITRATEGELATFLSKHSGEGGAIVVPVSDASQEGPLSPKALITLFEEIGAGINWRLRVGETDQHECKTSFGMKHAYHWLKPMAGLANNRGGYILFGVHDKGKTDAAGNDLSYVVCGIGDEFANMDPAAIANRVRATFDPTPRFEVITITVGGLSVGVMYVEQHPSRPVIALRAEQDVREGEIYYRYPGVTTRIKYSDLRAMLDERDARSRAAMIPMIEHLLTLGPSRAMVADLEAGALMDGKVSIHIDDTLVKRLSFIKEGEFTEKAGSPALRLLGNVTTTTTAAQVLRKGVVTRADLVGDFLSQNISIDPRESIRFAVEATQGVWLPLRYFAKQAGMTRAQLIAFVSSANAPPSRKQLLVARLKQKDGAFKKAGGASAEVLKSLEKGEEVSAPKSSKEAGVIAGAIVGLGKNSKVPLAVLLRTLGELVKVAFGSPASTVRRALCRVDELFFQF